MYQNDYNIVYFHNSIYTRIIYIILLLFILASIFILKFIYIDISVKVQGLTRPLNERTEVRSVISGIIETVFYKEGDTVTKEAVILRIKDQNTKSKRLLNNYETKQRQQFVHDLEILTNSSNYTKEGEIGIETISLLQSPLYKEQLNKYIHQKEQQEAALKKATKEVEMNAPLAKEKVISPKEFFDVQNNYDRINSTYKAFITEQLTNWQQDLARYHLELSQYQQQNQQINADASYYDVKAPVSGVIQGINIRYAGGLVQANETICSISPEGSLIGECYVQTKDVGLLKIGQSAMYQVEAFNYNYFGSLTGKIISIDNDFTVINNTPVIKVRCSFDSTQLHLKNGFTGKLQKGLNFQARFIVGQ